MSALFMHWRGMASRLWRKRAQKERKLNSRDTDCCDEYEDLVKWSVALSIKTSAGNHQLAQWSSISAAGAAPQTQLITERCCCNYHTLKATIVAVSTSSVKASWTEILWTRGLEWNECMVSNFLGPFVLLLAQDAVWNGTNQVWEVFKGKKVKFSSGFWLVLFQKIEYCPESTNIWWLGKCKRLVCASFGYIQFVIFQNILLGFIQSKIQVSSKTSHLQAQPW